MTDVDFKREALEYTTSGYDLVSFLSDWLDDLSKSSLGKPVMWAHSQLFDIHKFLKYSPGVIVNKCSINDGGAYYVELYFDIDVIGMRGTKLKCKLRLK